MVTRNRTSWVSFLCALCLLQASFSGAAEKPVVEPATRPAPVVRDRQYRADIEIFHDWAYRYGDKPDDVMVGRMLARAKEHADEPEVLFWAGRCEQEGLIPKGEIDGLQYYRRAAGLGHPAAMAQWGVELFTGVHVAKDVDAGRKSMRAAADKGDARALNALGGSHLVAHPGAPVDVLRAEQCMKQALEAGYFPAAANLAKIYDMQGDAKALASTERAAEMGEVQLLRSIIDYYGYDTNPPRDAAKAARYLLRGALWSDPVLMRRYAVAIRNTAFGLQKDPMLCVRLLTQAVRQGDDLARVYLAGVRIDCQIQPERGWRDLERLVEIEDGETRAIAQFVLGQLLYTEEVGVRQDRARGVALIEQSADRGLKTAREWLAKNRDAKPPADAHPGVGPASRPALPTSPEQAQAMDDADQFEDWMSLIGDPPTPQAVQRMLARARADNADAAAMTWAAVASVNGWAGKPAPIESVHWLRRAAELRHPLAMAIYGGAQLRGEIEPHDTATALKLVNDAIAAGEPTGLYVLGLAYQSGGVGIDKDPARAEELLLKAAGRGLGRAHGALAQLYKERGDWVKFDKHGLEAARLGEPRWLRETANFVVNRFGATAVRQPSWVLVVRGAVWGEPAVMTGLALYGDDDIHLKRRLLRRAAGLGHVQAQVVLAAAHVTCEYGVELDVDRGLFDLEAVLQKESLNVEALWQLGRILCEGINTPRDEERGRQLLEWSAKRGEALAKDWLAKHPASKAK
ncbi:MAG: tetratricopeptide repeat protein [Tepidisphaerales bacterium]